MAYRSSSIYSALPAGRYDWQGETLEEARMNLDEAVTMVLNTNRQMSEQSLEGAEVIRESLIVPSA